MDSFCNHNNINALSLGVRELLGFSRRGNLLGRFGLTGTTGAELDAGIGWQIGAGVGGSRLARQQAALLGRGASGWRRMRAAGWRLFTVFQASSICLAAVLPRGRGPGGAFLPGECRTAGRMVPWHAHRP